MVHNTMFNIWGARGARRESDSWKRLFLNDAASCSWRASPGLVGYQARVQVPENHNIFHSVGQSVKVSWPKLTRTLIQKWVLRHNTLSTSSLLSSAALSASLSVMPFTPWRQMGLPITTTIMILEKIKEHIWERFENGILPHYSTKADANLDTKCSYWKDLSRRRGLFALERIITKWDYSRLD